MPLQSSPVFLQQLHRQKEAWKGFGVRQKAGLCKDCHEAASVGFVSEGMVQSSIPWFLGSLLLLFQAATGECSGRAIPEEAMQSVPQEI